MSEISLTLTPSQSVTAIQIAQIANRSLYIWGATGIGKSQVASQVADSQNVAFIDVRLSQMEPTDIRGIPRLETKGGIETMSWVPPYVLPKDLDYSFVEILEAEESEIKFNNPIGSNHIHYCTDPIVSVKSVTKGLTATVVSQTLDTVTVSLCDADGVLSEGKVRVKILGKAKGILALEEFNSAPPSVQAAAYQFILDRRIGEYIVPEGIFIIAMGNRDTDRGITYKLATPVANRFEHVEMRSDYEEWNKWAISHGRIHPHIVGYLANANGHLFKFDPNTATRGFATPRSWHILSDMLYAMDKSDIREYVQRAIVCGAIGDEIGTLFDSFRKNLNLLPDIGGILDGTIRKFDSDEIGLQYTIVTLLLYRMKDEFELIRKEHGKAYRKAPEIKPYTQHIENAMQFIEKNFSTEILVMAYKTAITGYKLYVDPATMPIVGDFTRKYKKYLVSF